MHDIHPGTRVCIIFHEIRLKRQDGCDLFAVGFGLQSCVYHLLRRERRCTARSHHFLIIRVLGKFNLLENPRRIRHGGRREAQLGIAHD